MGDNGMRSSKANLNPHALGFQPTSRHITNTIHPPSSMFSRPSSTTSSNFSFASQPSQGHSNEGGSFGKSLAAFRLGDPFRDDYNPRRSTTMALDDGGHDFTRVPGHNPNFSLSNQYSPVGRDSTQHCSSETLVASASKAMARFTSPQHSPRRIANSTVQSESSWPNSTPNTSFCNSSFNSWKDRLETSATDSHQRHDSRQEEAAHRANAYDVRSTFEHEGCRSALTHLQIAQHIMSGQTAPPDDRGLNGETFQGLQGSASAASSLAVHISGSRMFGEHSVDKMLKINARSLPRPFQSHEPERLTTPAWFHKVMQQNYIPTLSEALSSIPIIGACRSTEPNPSTSVLRIANIPYAVTRQEVIAFIGKQAQINRMPVGSSYYAVHIIMERESGKTMDCFVELSTPKEAAWVVGTLQKRTKSGQPPKMDNRVVQPTVSSQEDLMHALFPRARHVAWNGNHPIIDFTSRQYFHGITAAGFQGFLHSEEFTGMLKVAEQDSGHNFAGKVPCRVYETMISIIHKYPFHAVDYVTLNERRAIFDLAEQMVGHLIKAIQNSTQHASKNAGKFQVSAPPPTVALLEELIVAVLSCPGFSERQKATIAHRLGQSVSATDYDRMTKNRPGLQLGGTHALSSSWPFLVIAPAPEVDYDFIRYYASLLRDGTMTQEDVMYMQHLLPQHAHQYKPFGNLRVDYGPRAEHMSLAEAEARELAQVQHVLRTMLPSA
jgi:hypothetical protein